MAPALVLKIMYPVKYIDQSIDLIQYQDITGSFAPLCNVQVSEKMFTEFYLDDSPVEILETYSTML
jgi:hypothetical protein